MNASGRLNTCKSRGNRGSGPLTTGARVSNAYATCLQARDSPGKLGLIPHVAIMAPAIMVKAEALGDGRASY